MAAVVGIIQYQVNLLLLFGGGSYHCFYNVEECTSENMTLNKCTV